MNLLSRTDHCQVVRHDAVHSAHLVSKLYCVKPLIQHPEQKHNSLC
jgi:hypothetical protein